ncbi:MFS transporter [Nonomuraea recticatena]|uniref:MFS transporter n=1 Tax=Nonomuraea recticatena TaxID=46178 RepID=A0ABN3TC16_9ACTN
MATARGWFAVVTVSLGIFALVTAEQLPIGLLTPLGSALGVSEGTAGLVVTVPGLVAALAAPLLPIVIGRLDRRWVLAGLIALMAASHAVSAITTSFAVMLAARVLVGVSIGGFWAIAGGLALRLVPERSVPRATAIVFGGVAAANVLGVPLGTWIGGLSGWQTAFAALGGLGLLILLALLAVLPRLPATRPVRPGELLAGLRDARVRAGILATGLLVTGHFAAFTFLSPALRNISGIGSEAMGPLLLAYGVAGIAGNFVSGAAAGRHVLRTLLVISLALAAALSLFPLLGRTPITGVVLLIAWGLAFGGVSVSLQTWMLKAAPHAAEASTSLYTSMFNFAIALGAFVGGLIVNLVAVSGVLWLGAALVLLTLTAVRMAHRAGGLT